MGHMTSISASTCITVLAFNYKSCLEAPLTLRRSCRSCFPIASWCATSSLTQLSPILHVRPCHHLSCHSLHLCCHLQDSCHLQSSVHQMSITTTDLLDPFRRLHSIFSLSHLHAHHLHLCCQLQSSHPLQYPPYRSPPQQIAYRQQETNLCHPLVYHHSPTACPVTGFTMM